MSGSKILGRVAENGRLSIPAGQRKLLGLEKGGRVVLTVENGQLTIRPVKQLLADIQGQATRLLGPSDGTEVDRFIEERRQEARRELERD